MLLAAEWTAFFYLGLLTLKRGPTRARTAGILALAVASSLYHGRGSPCWLPAARILAVAWWRARRPGGAPRVELVAGAAALTLATAYAGLRYATLGQLNAVERARVASYLAVRLAELPGSCRPCSTGLVDRRDAFVDPFYWVRRRNSRSSFPRTRGMALRVDAAGAGSSPSSAWCPGCAPVESERRAAGARASDRPRSPISWTPTSPRTVACGRSSDPVITGRSSCRSSRCTGWGPPWPSAWLPRRLAGIAGA